ncbi:helix-turn-helix transcriptional regulator [Marinicella meishanensis]|uniref:helix-turn-helix transcriptional regulator n=1 Tax=Marinicella meishanensis TaxID=2873263 RepID=UPI001CC09DC3|nr:helix-turn-helix transcriptional regulator [Marinicella sp. NBU2979]
MPWLSHLFAIGAAQALVLAFALWRKSANGPSNRVLAVWMLLLMLDLAMRVVQFHDPLTPWLPLHTLVQFFPFLHGSFFYLYVRTLCRQQAIRWTDGVHLLGFLYMAGVNIPWILDPWRQGPRGFAYFELTLFTYSVSYVLAGLWVIRNYRRRLAQQLANTEGLDLLWLTVMAYFQVVIWLIAVLQWLAPWTGLNVAMIYLAVATWISVMGYLALAQRHLSEWLPIEPPSDETADAKLESDPRVPAVTAKLAELMQQQQLYLEPGLSIAQVAKKSGYPIYLVSQVINQTQQQTFREYINHHRIQTAQQMMRDPNNAMNILEIAYACGFTAKSTFNSAFKQQLHMTPSQFKSKLATKPPAAGAE